MWNRTEGTRAGLVSRGAARRRCAPVLEGMEVRQLLAASLAPIATVSSPQFIGYQVSLDGSASGSTSQTYTVKSSNPDVVATVATGQFMTVNVTHTAADSKDISFTGSMTYQLFGDLTPNTVASISNLVNQGFYTNQTFHRVSPGFPGPTDYIVQGGSVNGDGTGTPNQPGYPFPDEFVPQLAFTGTYQLAMANAGSDTNSSQFFVTTGSPRFLDYKHTIFAQLVSGQDIVTKMTQVETTSADKTKPLSPITMTSVTLANTNPNGVIHINTTGSKAGETSTVVVTATDPSTHTTATQSFGVNVVITDPSVTERPFLNPVPGNVKVGVNQTSIFQLRATDVNPAAVLTFTVQGGVSGGAFTPVQNATATVDQATGIVTVKPNAGFTGVINLLVGVRDQFTHGAAVAETPSNYDTQQITMTVTSGGQITQTPIALNSSATVNADQPTNLNLLVNNANPGATSPPTLTFAITTQPKNGTITSLNPTTGALTYTPKPGFNGTDSLQFTASAPSGSSTLTSLPATVTISVQGGAVRVINRVLVVTPAPRTDGGTNTIHLTQVNGNINVTVNGVLDSTQPAAGSLDLVVVYGSKNSDNIQVDAGITLPTTLDGGHGGKNTVVAGSGSSTLHGWFGQNTLTGGAGNDRLIGRKGHVRFIKSPGRDLLFAGIPKAKGFLGQSRPPVGTYYKFKGTKLVAIKSPPKHVIHTHGSGG